MKNLSFLFTLILISTSAFAARGGGASLGGGNSSIGIGVGMMTASQDDLESHAALINQTSGRNAVKPGSGLEFSGFYEYRFSSSMFALHLQPSYFTQDGKGSTDKTTLTGYTVFPMLRLYPLENAFIRFYMQAGVGYGKLSGKIEQPSTSVEFSGSAFGAAAGLGATFCFTGTHCMYLEGNFRYLPLERNLVSSVGTTAPDGFTKYGSGQELEFNNNDLKTTMSGIVGSVGYQLNF